MDRYTNEWVQIQQYTAVYNSVQYSSIQNSWWRNEALKRTAAVTFFAFLFFYFFQDKEGKAVVGAEGFLVEHSYRYYM